MTPTMRVPWDTVKGTAQRSRFLAALEEDMGKGGTGFVRFIAEQPEPSTERNRQRREAFFNTPFSICAERNEHK